MKNGLFLLHFFGMAEVCLKRNQSMAGLCWDFARILPGLCAVLFQIRMRKLINFVSKNWVIYHFHIRIG